MGEIQLSLDEGGRLSSAGQGAATARRVARWTVVYQSGRDRVATDDGVVAYQCTEPNGPGCAPTGNRDPELAPFPSSTKATAASLDDGVLPSYATGVGALLLLAAIIGAIVYGLRRNQREYVVSVPSHDPGETWKFSVRDMRADVIRTASSRHLRSFDLRRNEDGRWELADDHTADDQPENRRWSACEEYVQGTLESTYRSYEGAS